MEKCFNKLKQTNFQLSCTYIKIKKIQDSYYIWGGALCGNSRRLLFLDCCRGDVRLGCCRSPFFSVFLFNIFFSLTYVYIYFLCVCVYVCVCVCVCVGVCVCILTTVILIIDSCNCFSCYFQLDFCVCCKKNFKGKK